MTTLPLTSISTVYVSPSESALQSALFAKGPISVAIDASDDSIQFYYQGRFERQFLVIDTLSRNLSCVHKKLGNRSSGSDLIESKK